MLSRTVAHQTWDKCSASPENSEMRHFSTRMASSSLPYPSDLTI